MNNLVLNNDNKEASKKFFEEVLRVGIDFKLQDTVKTKSISDKDIKRILVDLPDKGIAPSKVLSEFKKNVSPFCTNFSSTHFLGFPDSGNSVAAIGGSILADFFQQNLINQSVCSPSATFVEIAVIQWLRKAVRYKNVFPKDIWGSGGVITPGGTVSNAIAMMLARENKIPGTLENGVIDPQKFKIIVPKGIGHYSVKSAQMWIGCGHNLIEVETKDFRYDLDELSRALKKNKGNIMAIVAYAGDSRTMTIDQLDKVADLVHSIDSSIWLHADACHGFSLGFSKKLRYKIKGINKFDSISCDPHKVLLTPYTMSALLVRNSRKLKTITSLSDLIMQEQFAFGQITPFLGSKSWMSLKLWFMMKSFGKNGLDTLITNRHYFALKLSELLKKDIDFEVLNDVEINSVAFFFTGGRKMNVKDINSLNKEIYSRILKENKFHLHQFSIPDNGLFKRGELVHPLRFMCGNPNSATNDILDMVEHIRAIGYRIIK